MGNTMVGEPAHRKVAKWTAQSAAAVPARLSRNVLRVHGTLVWIVESFFIETAGHLTNVLVPAPAPTHRPLSIRRW